MPVNVTLLFSAEQYLAAADAYMSGLERRVEQGLDPAVGSVASVFMSRWGVAVAGSVPAELDGELALAIGGRTYAAYRRSLESDRFQRLENAGARAQRLLWASTSSKDPNEPDTMYVHGLAAPFTVNTMPESTLRAFADHGEVGEPLSADGSAAEAMLSGFATAGVDVGALAVELQTKGAASFVDSWHELLDAIDRAGRQAS